MVDDKLPSVLYWVEPDRVLGAGGWCVRTSGEHNSKKYYKTEEEANAALQEIEAKGECVVCSAYLYDNYIEPTKTEIQNKKTCFSCLYWQNLMDNPKGIVIDGRHYIVGDPIASPNHCKGHAGRRFIIEMLDGTTVSTDNLWSQGYVPLRFRDQLPDSARFVSKGNTTDGVGFTGGV